MRSPASKIDLLRLAELLDKHQVQYVIIGGAAMALHGMPRMTKDIDLFIPVDVSNNGRLLNALREFSDDEESLNRLSKEWMDKGHSTALEAKTIAVDLLYVAAALRFEDVLSHVVNLEIDGVLVKTLDIDGMLLTKNTSRESDIPDREKLRRLKKVLAEQKND
jgi:predicted nucleotidyltransferase